MLRGIFCLLLAISSLQAVIHEVARFHEVPGHATADTVVLIDIDDTLLVPAQMLGSDVWFAHRLGQHRSNGTDLEVAIEKTLDEWQAVRYLTRVELVEGNVSGIIASLQREGVTVMGLTTQELTLSTRTIAQLREHGMDFSLAPFHDEELCFSVRGRPVLYREGILFTSGQSKGERFFQFCERIGKMPTKIVAVDDKLSHLKSLEKEALLRGVEFIGLRYGFSDAQKMAFSPEVADYQLTHSTLTHLVSDEEAREALESQ
jgi:hypothetical protein